MIQLATFLHLFKDTELNYQHKNYIATLNLLVKTSKNKKNKGTSPEIGGGGGGGAPALAPPPP